MYVSDEKCCQILNEKGCSIESIKSVNMGSQIYSYDKELIGTIGLGPCVGILLFNKNFTFLAHVDMGNMIGNNFSENIPNGFTCNFLKSSFDKIKNITGSTEIGEIYLACFSSETFVYDEKWWSERALKLDRELMIFVEKIEELNVCIKKLPYINSTFVAIDGSDGTLFCDDFGYAIKTNIKNTEEKKYLYSSRSI